MAKIEACRGCGAHELVPGVDLGGVPLANALLPTMEAARTAPRYPLEVLFCRACALVQLGFAPPPEELFGDYPYLSSTATSFVDHARRLVERVCATGRLAADGLAVEVASNDGYLLQHYRTRGIPVLGIEPAANIAEIARRDRQVHTLCAFFGRDVAHDLVRQDVRADVLHAHNVMAHVPDIRGFLEGIAVLLKPGGVAIIEVPQLAELLRRNAFDTIYHEHVFYFSLLAIDRLFAASGLEAADVEPLEVHGGSLRIYAVRADDDRNSWRSDAGRARLESQHALERAMGLDRETALATFGARVAELCRDLRALVEGLKADGARIVAYGAAAKGSTLLNVCGLNNDDIAYTVDRNRLKQGLYMAGVALPIHAPDRLLRDRPEFTLILPWNIVDDIRREQAAYERVGGRFLIPIPEPRVLEPTEP